MITTREQIGDPVAFLQADPSLLRELSTDPDSFSHISGADFIICIGRSPSYTNMTTYRSEREISEILGPLYRFGEAWNVSVGSTNVAVDWYPSAEYMNNLSEALDRQPGADAFRFTYDQIWDTEIPLRDYLAYLANGDFPQSVSTAYNGRYLFAHDGDSSHAIGVFLMPPVAVETIKSLAMTVLGKGIKLGAQASLGDSFEITTGNYRYFVERVWNHLQASNGRVPDSITGLYDNGAIATALWDIDRASSDRLDKLAALTLKHLTDLRPKLEALKANATSARVT